MCVWLFFFHKLHIFSRIRSLTPIKRHRPLLIPQSSTPSSLILISINFFRFFLSHLMLSWFRFSHYMDNYLFFQKNPNFIYFVDIYFYWNPWFFSHTLFDLHFWSFLLKKDDSKFLKKLKSLCVFIKTRLVCVLCTCVLRQSINYV